MRSHGLFTGHTGAVYALARYGAPGTFLSGSGDGTVVRWDRAQPDKGELLVRTDQAVFSLFHHTAERDPGSQRLFIGGEHGDLRVVDLDERKEMQLIRAHQRGIFRIVALPGERIACAGGDGVLSIWSIRGGRIALLRPIPLEEGKLRDLALDATGAHLAVACGDGTVRLLSASDFNELHTLEAHVGGATAVAWHPYKPVLATGGKDGHLRLWHTGEGLRPLQDIAAHRSTIYTIAFRPDGQQCASTSRDKTAKLWDAGSFDPIVRLDRQAGGHAMSVNAALWMEHQLITAGDDRRILSWAP